MELVDVPTPRLSEGFVRVRNMASVVSPGTERQMMALASKSLVGKARARPDLVRKVLGKLQHDGLAATYRAVTSKLAEPVPAGYASAGRVMDSRSPGCSAGTLVACAGAGYASHAEEIVVPRNLVVPVPDGLPVEQAAFGTLGAIALQGVRILKPELGEIVAVVGLGLLGLLSVQILRAAGCRVLGTDMSAERAALAERFGAEAAWTHDREDLPQRFLDVTNGYGVDAVLVTASSPDNGPMVLAGDISRDRGRVVVVGSVKTEFDRNLYYNKELEVRLSRSYGPGRYDPRFEERGQVYPRGYVRFTETENLRCFLDLVAEGKVDVASLITHRFPIAEALRAYETLLSGKGQPLGIVLTYPNTSAAPVVELAARRSRPHASGKLRVSFVGAGAFARSVLLPSLNGLVDFRLVATSRGFTADAVHKRWGFDFVANSAEEILDDPETDVVVIATRHGSHAELVAKALDAGKHVFCEKPLAIDGPGLDRVEKALAKNDGLLQVGHNRRFAPFAQRARAVRDDSHQPSMLQMRINAGAIPAEHWTVDRAEGGGRMIGEGCHFVDLARYLIGSSISGVEVTGLSGDRGASPDDNYVTTLTFGDGSLATIMYTAMGDPRLAKEHVELFAGGSVAVIEDFSRFKIFRGGKVTSQRTLAKNKGHKEQIESFLHAIRSGGPLAVPVEELIEVGRATLAQPLALRVAARVRSADFRTVVDEEPVVEGVRD